MSWTSFFIHLADFFLPVVFMMFFMLIWHALKRRHLGFHRWRIYGLSMLLSGVLTQLAMVWWTGKEGNLLGYAVLCVVMGGVNWLWTEWGFKVRVQ